MDPNLQSPSGAPSNGQAPTSTSPPTNPPSPPQAIPTYPSPTPSGLINAVMVPCRRSISDPRWSPTTIPSNHPIFDCEVPPIPALLDLPIVMYRVGTQDDGNLGNLENMPVAYLNMKPEDGSVPIEWQSGVGTVIVARKDKKNLHPRHFEAIYMYCLQIRLDFLDGYGAPEELYVRTVFERWFETYKQGSSTFAEYTVFGGRLLVEERAWYGGAGWESVPPLYDD